MIKFVFSHIKQMQGRNSMYLHVIRIVPDHEDCALALTGMTGEEFYDFVHLLRVRNYQRWYNNGHEN